jgi:hypothetical protein
MGGREHDCNSWDFGEGRAERMLHTGGLTFLGFDETKTWCKFTQEFCTP